MADLDRKTCWYNREKECRDNEGIYKWKRANHWRCLKSSQFRWYFSQQRLVMRGFEHGAHEICSSIVCCAKCLDHRERNLLCQFDPDSKNNCKTKKSPYLKVCKMKNFVLFDF